MISDDRKGGGTETGAQRFLHCHVHFPAWAIKKNGWDGSKGDRQEEACMVRTHGKFEGNGTREREEGNFEKRFIDKDEVDEGRFGVQ